MSSDMQVDSETQRNDEKKVEEQKLAPAEDLPPPRFEIKKWNVRDSQSPAWNRGAGGSHVVMGHMRRYVRNLP